MRLMAVSSRWFLGGGFTAVMWLTGHFTLRGLVTLASGVMALFLYVLWAYQESLLYQPKVFPQYTRPQDNPPGYRHPAEHGMPYEDVWMDTEDGVRLHAWWVRPDKVEERRARATLIFFHANAGSTHTTAHTTPHPHTPLLSRPFSPPLIAACCCALLLRRVVYCVDMGFRLDNIRQMYYEFKLNVFILSYRGYGNSGGFPTEKGLLLDAETTWQHVIARPDVDHARVIIFGRSLGGSVAIALASQHSPPLPSSPQPHPSPPYIAGLIVENTFTSISSLVNTLFPLLSPLKPLILRLDWPAIRRIAAVTQPILFLSGSLDEVVPAQHMQDLYDAATHARAKSILKVARGLHNNTWSEGGDEYRRAVVEFLEKHVGVNVHGRGEPLERGGSEEGVDGREKLGDSGLVQRRLDKAAGLHTHSTL